VIDPRGLPLEPLTEPFGTQVLVHVEMPAGRMLHARIWHARVGRVPLLLLDTDIRRTTATRICAA